MAQQDASDIQEKQLVHFLKKLGFNDVDGGRNFIVGGRQIDAVAGHENTLIIFECTTQNDDLPGKIEKFRGSANEKIHALKQHDVYNKYHKYKLVFVLGDQPITQPLEKRAEASKPEIAIWDNKLLSYYRSLHESIRQFAKYSLLAELGVKPDNAEELSVPAFSIETSGGGRYRLFIFSVQAADFVRFCYVARRQTGGENYYQRMIKNSRLVY